MCQIIRPSIHCLNKEYYIPNVFGKKTVNGNMLNQNKSLQRSIILSNSHILAEIQAWDLSLIIIKLRRSYFKHIIVVIQSSITVLQSISLLTLGQFYT